MLDNKTIDGFVLGQYYAEVRLASIDEELAIVVDQTEPISVGIVFDAPPAYDGLRKCLQKRLFLRVLDNGALLHRKLAKQRTPSTPFQAAENALRNDDSIYNLAMAAGAVTCVLAVAGIVDFIVLKYAKKTKKREVTKTENNRVDNEAEV
jgi:hypothetical protein